MPNPRPLVRVAGAALGFVLAGCATVQNTPQQDYVWACVTDCKASLPPQCQVDNVAPDGRVSARCDATLANLDSFKRCLDERYRDRPYAQWLKERGR